jgi:hypothetical protein
MLHQSGRTLATIQLATLALVLALGFSLRADEPLEVPADVVAAPPAGLPHAFDAGWQGHKTCTLLYENTEVRVGRCTFPPGVGHEKHYHYPHYGYVLEGGTMEILDDTGRWRITTEANDDWSTDTITVHEALNVGDTTTSYLIVEPKAQAQ